MIFMISLGITIRSFHLLPETFISVFYTGLSIALILTGEVFNQVTIPIRRIFAPAIIQTVPAVISKICLLTPYFIGFFIVINGLTVRFVDSLLVESRN